MKQFGEFRLDTDSECLWREGEQIMLPPKPFALLRYLIDHAGRLITHDELLDAVWPETFVQPQVLRTYVNELRKILGDTAGQPRFIQTQPRRGYRFMAAVAEIEGVRGAGGAAAKRTGGEEELDFCGASAIFGRESELEHLEAQLASALSGHRRVVFIGGEAGIGKTALVDAFCSRRLSAGGVSIARGQCLEGFGEVEEYYPLMEALGQLCLAPGGDAASSILARAAPAWLPSAGRIAAATTGGGAGERLPGDFCVALEELTVQQPLILVLEDLHWADEATLNLLSAITRRRGPARLLIVGTCRPRDLEKGQPSKRLKQDLLIRQLCTEIVLNPLGRAAIEEMLRRKLRERALPPGLAAFVHQHSEGNPLFAIAIVEHLIAQRYLERRGAGGVQGWEQRGSLEDSEAGVPAGLAQMIELEMQNLAPEHQRLLEAGSLMGVAFPVWAVAAALDQEVAGVEEACEELARRLYFVECAGEDELPDGSRSTFYVFVHGLYREVIYRRQSSSRRSTGHLRIARRLGELYSGREAGIARELAQHREAGGDWSGAANALRAAAGHAFGRQAHAEAAELLDRAVRVTEKLEGEASQGARSATDELLPPR